MAFLKKFNIKKNCVGNHQAMNILSNFDSRKTEYREMIGSSVQDFGSFYQKPLEPIFTKDARQPLWNGISDRNKCVTLERISSLCAAAAAAATN